ncbi:phiSA1p31-related protein [Streptomyces sp. NPDC088923]|uniref:phiSA1p31-related protein n=1 Tax=Streptomyces sp. NPDC088923 TaxID=3365913 RepID=UPI00381E3887
MPSITVSELRRMLKQVTPHVPTDLDLPISHLLLEQRDGWLYAVGTDRYTLAVSRRAVGNNGDAHGVLPAAQIPALTAWLSDRAVDWADATLTLNGRHGVEVRVDGHGQLRAEANDYQKPVRNWRAMILAQLRREPAAVPLTAFTSEYLARWQHAGSALTAWQADPGAPLVITGEHPQGDVVCGDFIGMQMPCRVLSTTREQIVDAWTEPLAQTTVDGTTYDLRATWLDADGDPWTWNGSTDNGMPLMVLDGCETDPYRLDTLVTEHGPLRRA